MRNKKKSSTINSHKHSEEDAIEKVINLWHSLQVDDDDDEEQITKEQIKEFLKKELLIYLNFLRDIETKCKEGYISYIQKLNYKDPKSVANFLFVLEIMISNLKRILKMQTKEKIENDEEKGMKNENDEEKGIKKK